MFTPPPSPLPPQNSLPDQPQPAVPLEPLRDTALKRKRSSRLRWSILTVPIILVLVTLTTRYISHPALFDTISAFPYELDDNATFDDWGLHKRHYSSRRQAVPPGSDPPPPVTTVPTIPVDPLLPTPFPQAFDTTFSKNFSTQACIDFYTNMTLSLQFRQCRSFGLLAAYSSQFINVSS